MINDELIRQAGTVTLSLGGSRFHVQLPNGHTVVAHVSGRMRSQFPAINLGDTVDLELSPYDLDKGRIVFHQA